MTANVIERRAGQPAAEPAADQTSTEPSAADEDGTHRPEPADAAETIPEDVVDRLLWRDAQYVLARHHETDDSCGYCGAVWPCTATRLAQRAEAAARLPWREGWTTRHDLNAMLALPRWRAAKPPAVRRPFAR